MVRRRRNDDRGKRGRKTASRQYITGKLTVTASGFGFVKPESGEQDIFIPPKYLNGAIDGDLVKVGLEKPKRGMPYKGPAGSIEQIVERSRQKVVGELIAGHKVRPLAKRLPEDIPLQGGTGDAKRGDWVEVALQPGTAKTGWQVKGEITAALGKGGSIAADLVAVAREYELPERYSEEEDREALVLKPLPLERTNLTDLFCVTVDPADAKDYDDAVSVSPGKKKHELVLGVHIADVAAWIPVDSIWDKKARERGFTAYLPGDTRPMLPKGLTKQISLQPEMENFAHSVLITVDAKRGKVLRTERCRSKIRIGARLNFDEVQEFITGDTPAEWNADLVSELKKVVALYRAMRRFRQQEEEFLELATTEIRVICDDETKEISGIVRKTQREADELIEEFMLAGNVAVAMELLEKHTAGLYRIHPEPDPEKIMEFSIFCEETFGLSPGDLSSRCACNNFLSNLPDDHRKPVLVEAFLRSMNRACYQEKNGLHFGLGKGVYGHFTSPIRRYPDLVTHQQLWHLDQAAQGVAQNRRTRLRGDDEVANFAATCNEQEMKNDEAYYAANDRLKLHWMKQYIADPEKGMYEGVVKKLSKAGLLVDIPDIGVMGFVPIEYLEGRFRKHGGCLLSVAGHQQYRCGDFIYLRLEKADMIRGQAVFRPVR